MFSFFKTKAKGERVVLQLSGMHCTSCAINIDGALEDTAGVFAATTSYAKSQVTVQFDPKVLSVAEIIKILKKEGYTASTLAN